MPSQGPCAKLGIKSGGAFISRFDSLAEGNYVVHIWVINAISHLLHGVVCTIFPGVS